MIEVTDPAASTTVTACLVSNALTVKTGRPVADPGPIDPDREPRGVRSAVQRDLVLTDSGWRTSRIAGPERTDLAGVRRHVPPRDRGRSFVCVGPMHRRARAVQSRGQSAQCDGSFVHRLVRRGVQVHDGPPRGTSAADAQGRPHGSRRAGASSPSARGCTGTRSIRRIRTSTSRRTGRVVDRTTTTGSATGSSSVRMWVDSPVGGAPAITAADLVPDIWVEVQRQLPTPIPRIAPGRLRAARVHLRPEPHVLLGRSGAGAVGDVTGTHRPAGSPSRSRPSRSG